MGFDEIFDVIAVVYFVFSRYWTPCNTVLSPWYKVTLQVQVGLISCGRREGKHRWSNDMYRV